MRDEIMQELYKTFRLSTRQGQGGMTFKYVPNEDVINRMNEVFNGDWSTSVKFRNIVDDQVILEVEVKVFDQETQMAHSHIGFGSQQIMRYNSGPNQGKIIDIGNGYKGALSKAIVNACTRWGVGLFKESNPYNEEEIVAATEPAMPNVPVAMPAPVAASVPPPAPAVPTPVVPPTVPVPVAVAPPAPAVPVPVVPAPTAPVAVAPAATANVPLPPTPPPAAVPVPTVPAPVAETTTTFAPPMMPEQPVSANIVVEQAPSMPSVPAPQATPDLPFSKEEGLAGVVISDVQKVALNGILTMNNANYDELALEAFQASGINKPVPNKEDLNYEEAVVVIKFGNEKYRKNR